MRPNDLKDQNFATGNKTMNMQRIVWAAAVIGLLVLSSCGKGTLAAEEPKTSSIDASSQNIGDSTKDELDEAIAKHTEAIRLNPKDDKAYYLRGYCYFARGEIDKAMPDFTKAIQLEPKNAAAYNSRGIVYVETGELDKAIADYTKAIRLNPKDATAHVSRGYTYYEKGEFEKSIADYTEAIRLDPRFVFAYSGLAWVLATCPEAKYLDGKKAIEHATKACELTHWKAFGLFDSLAAAYAEAGDFKNAVKWQEKAVDMTDGRQPGSFRSRLDLYREGKPYRQEPKWPKEQPNDD